MQYGSIKCLGRCAFSVASCQRADFDGKKPLESEMLSALIGGVVRTENVDQLWANCEVTVGYVRWLALHE